MSSKGLVQEFLAEKPPEGKGIPAPVTAAYTPGVTRSRLSVWKKRLFVVSSLIFGLVLFHKLAGHAGFALETAVEPVPTWVMQFDASGHGKHKKGHHHHPPPFGKRAEKIFLSVPNNDSAIETSRLFTKTPHMAGTSEDLRTATDFLAILQKELNISAPEEEPIFKAGTESSRNATLLIPKQRHSSAWIDVYYPALNTPLNRSIEILDENGESVWQADLEEKAGSGDDDAEKYAEAIPAFHGLSRDGVAQGKLVYANYGRKEDYDELEEAGVSLNGSIVIVKYFGIFRGLKVKGAQERGALACLIFSDPRDDGSVTVENGYEAYPEGPARNPTSVQRGSVQYLSIYPGDPTTPGYPAYENSTRTEGSNIPSIPSLPISWNNAQKLLEEIGENGKDRIIKVVNHVEGKATPIWNVMGVIPGHIKDEVVVVGNHRDAWVMGATDPTSGTVSLVETIRGLGVLLRKGWRPLRTILIANWDAEEYGLIGSTEWGEDFPEWISKYVVAYLNLDSSVSGSRFSVQASPSLAHLMKQTAEDVPHPTIAGRTLWQARLDSGDLFGPVDPEVQKMYDEEFGNPFAEEELAMTTSGAPVHSQTLGVSPLGSGSDYTVFLQRIGVASANHGFGSSLSDPVYHYHSVFDSETWQEKYGDPGFHRHVAIAQHLGLQILRIADALVLPLNTTQYAYELDAYLNKVEDIAASQHLATDFTALRQSITSLQTASQELDKEKVAAEKTLRKLVRILRRRHAHKAWLRKHLRKLKWKVCKLFKKCKEKHESTLHSEPTCKGRLLAMEGQHSHENNWSSPPRHPRGPHPRLPHGPTHRPAPRIPPWLAKKLVHAAMRVRKANTKLIAFERGFISKEGIKDREWYKHLGVAPGKWLGYGATTFPALTESLTLEKNATMAQHEAARLEKLIDALAKEIIV